MTLNDVLTKVNIEKSNSLPQEYKAEIVRELEEVVYDYLGLDDNTPEFEWPEDKDAELYITGKYANVYISYLKARIDQINGQYDEYSNDLAQYNAEWDDWKSYAMRSGMVINRLPNKFKNWW